MGLVFMFFLVIILFSGMSLVTADMAIGIIGIFHRRYPGYPGNSQQKADNRSPDRAVSPLHGEE